MTDLINNKMNKRDFIKSAAVITGATAVSSLVTNSKANEFDEESVALHINSNDKNKKVVLKKSLGLAMIKENLSLTDKFKLVKDLGFHGVELDSPIEFTLSEVIEARDKSGIELPSVVNKDHWNVPLSDPDPEVRKKCITSVAKSLEEIKELGGDTVLVVPGVVNEKVSYEAAYITSQNSIRELIPFAEKTGMQIGIENVWNNFLISPIEAKQFIDEINHPLIGWYFDIGNVLRYGWPQHWIKTLHSRIKKLHIKEYSLELMNTSGLWEGFNVELLKGDINWTVVMKTVSEVNHQGGWLTVEVPGGDRNHLKQISAQMDQIISYL